MPANDYDYDWQRSANYVTRADAIRLAGRLNYRLYWICQHLKVFKEFRGLFAPNIWLIMLAADKGQRLLIAGNDLDSARRQEGRVLFDSGRLAVGNALRMVLDGENLRVELCSLSNYYDERDRAQRKILDRLCLAEQLLEHAQYKYVRDTCRSLGIEQPAQWRNEPKTPEAASSSAAFRSASTI